MHRVLEQQLRLAIDDDERIDVARLLSIVDAHYDKLENAQSAPTELQIAFDSVADAVIAIDSEGIVTYSNLAAAQAFGMDGPRIEGLPLARLLPAFGGSAASDAIESCLTDFGDTSYKIQTAEFEAVRLDGRRFTAEVNASAVEGSARNAYVLCLRDITASRLSRAHLEESEERYRALVEHAPEAILVLDVDTNQFVDVNENAVRLFNMSRKRLMKIGPEGISPKFQLDGKPSFGHARGYIQRALDGERPVFEWLHLDADGQELPSEVRFIRLPSATRRLIRASVTSIAERKRQELLTYGENRILEMIAHQTELGATMKAVCRTIGQVISDARAAVLTVTDKDSLILAAAPNLPLPMRQLLSELPLSRLGVPAVEVVRTSQRVLLTDCAQHSADTEFADCVAAHHWQSVWAFPVQLDDEIGAVLCIFLERSSRPGTEDLDAVSGLIRLAEIALKRDRDEKRLRASEQRFRGLFENVVDGVYISNPAGRITAANPALVAMLGYDSMAELAAEGSTENLYVNQQDFRRFIETLHRDHVVKNFEVRLRRRDGRQIVVLENARAVRDDAGVIVAHEGTITDITERKRAETRVFEEKERAQVTLNSIGDGVITTDAEGRVDYLNPVAADLTGWEPRAARGRPVDQIFTIIDHNSRAMLDNPVLRCLREGRVITLPEASALVDRNGKAIEIQDSTAPIRDRIGNVIGAVMVFHELNKASRLSRQLSYQAAHDSLTGLINRREFENQLSQLIDEAGRDTSIAHVLLLIDVDQFQVLNDSFGHTAGDEYLRQLADVIQAEVRVSDILARLGGDEFAVLLRNCSLDRANQVAESIRRGIEQFVFHWQERMHSSRVSIGVVVIDHGITDTGSAFSAADVACFAAKDAGRNRVHVYESGEASSVQQAMQWAERLTAAVEEDRMELYFQPISAIGTLTGRLGQEHYELLLRMRDEQGEIIAPGAFIPAAERFNLMPMLDRWVVDRAIDGLVDKTGIDGEAQYTVAINLSGNSLSDDRFLDYLAERIGELKLPERAICFEITETSAIANIDRVAQFMKRLKAVGCLFALDDFGSGLSSFSYLKSLPVDFIKIDGAFIDNVTHDLMDQSLVSAISQVGRSLGVYIVAERVESEDVLQTLESIGVEYAQGFHIARPAPVSEFRRETVRRELTRAG